MSLYRKYRPKSFSDVAGQQSVVTTLTQAVAQDKLSHAYLFSGTRGTGKTSIARILAKIILTRGMEEGPLKEQIAQAVDEGNLVDLVEIDAASNRGIDDIRSLVEKIQFSPVVAKAKVYIIDEVHMLTREAFNALLKTLEEPPPYAFFILATTELHKIPPTIQSRCQRYLFRQISEEDIIARLRFIAKEEKINVEEEALRAIAHYVQGGLRDAVSLLDQLRSLDSITLQDVKSRIGESGFEYVEQVMDAVRSSDTEVVLKIVKRLEEVGIPLEHFARLLLQQSRHDLHHAIERKLSILEAKRMVDTLLTAMRDLRTSPVPGLVMESALLSLCGDSPIESSRTAPIVTQVRSPQAPASPQPKQDIEVTSKRVNESTDVPDQVLISHPQLLIPNRQSPVAITLDAIKPLWPDIIRSLDAASARMSLKNGMLHSLKDSTLFLSFTSAFHRDKAMTPDAVFHLGKALEEKLGTKMAIEAILDTDAPTTVTKEDIVNLADAAAEIF